MIISLSLLSSSSSLSSPPTTSLVVLDVEESNVTDELISTSSVLAVGTGSPPLEQEDKEKEQGEEKTN